jgi:hypothetical protein
MKRLIPSLALSLALVPFSSAFAQWQFSADAGTRYVRMTETGTDGRQLVREHGWLPGIGLAVRYAGQDWRFGLAGEIYSNDITYDGRLQNGAPFASETNTTQWRVRLDAEKPITHATHLIAGIEYDVWQRDILGRDSVAGLQERHASWRLLAGVKSRIAQWDTGAIDMQGLLVFARPEQLRVRFDQQLFDEVQFQTKSAVGIRFGFSFRPAALPSLSVETDIDWIDIGRSDSATLRRNGTAAGTVTQAKHERTAIGLRVKYDF